MSVIGIDGLPSNLSMAGNAIVRELTLRCSLRLAPTQKGADVEKLLHKAFIEDVRDETFGAKIEFNVVDIGDGFSAPDLPADLKTKLFDSCKNVFNGEEPLFVGCGGSIPFMEVFDREFPGTQFLLTGVGFSDSNAHSANENLDLDFTAKLTAVIGQMLAKI